MNTEFLKHSDCVTESVKNGYPPYVLMPNIYHQSLMSWNARRKTFNKYANFLTGRQHIFFKMHYIIVHVVANATFWQPSFFASQKQRFFPDNRLVLTQCIISFNGSVSNLTLYSTSLQAIFTPLRNCCNSSLSKMCVIYNKARKKQENMPSFFSKGF